MSSSAEEARDTAGNLSPATKPQDRVRLNIHVLGTDDSGSDDHLSSERRGTPHETPEGLDRGDTTRSDHPDHLHMEPNAPWSTQATPTTAGMSSPSGAPGGARTPARRLISWGPPAIWPTRAHPQAHCSTEAPANTARRLGRGSMTSPATCLVTSPCRVWTIHLMSARVWLTSASRRSCSASSCSSCS